jgi:hypothetical protein
MEYQKHCFAATPDPAKASHAFMGTVASKFTPEAYHTLRRYLSTGPDVKNEINLLLRAQKFTDAGMAMTKRALSSKGDAREKHTILMVRFSIRHSRKTGSFVVFLNLRLFAFTGGCKDLYHEQGHTVSKSLHRRLHRIVEGSRGKENQCAIQTLNESRGLIELLIWYRCFEQNTVQQKLLQNLRR